ncbi:MAG: class I SAM-dependent methyltransferase [Rhodomicrobium sp.]
MGAPIEAHNLKPAATWNSAGARYDDISRGIADSIEHCVLRLNPQPGEYILDLATGTGWTSRVLARRGVKVIGLDLGADLIATARERAKAEGLDVAYRVGDAEKLPFADGEFDAVVSTCGVMFASRPEAAASEIARAARAAGSPKPPGFPTAMSSRCSW